MTLKEIKNQKFEKKWTENQKMAIDSKGQFTVVSASAGSGKTAVIVERIIKLITVDLIDIDRILIVTFTRASAEELKERILKRILDEIKKTPFDKNLRRQEFLINFSTITTIDGFCNKIIKENFNECNVSLDFKIIENHEFNIILNEAIESTLEEIYKQTLNQDPNLENSNEINAIEFFIDDKNDEKIFRIISKLYSTVKIYENDNVFFEISRKNCEDFSNDKKNICTKIIKEEIKNILKIIINKLKYAVENCYLDEKIKKKYFENINGDLNVFIEIDKKIECSEYDYKFNIQNIVFKKLNSVRNCSEEIKEKIKKYRDEAKKIFSVIMDYIFCFENIKEDCDKIIEIIDGLFNIFNKVMSKIKIIKSKRKLVDFSDLEHLVSELIKDDKMRNKISYNYDEIMIDEYQDVNFTQDKIFKSISKNLKNLFIVGDVKQSIYKFRQAVPEIFNNYLKMCDYKKEFKKIILEKNFRSCENVINDVNFIFKTIMNDETCGVNYNHEHELICTVKDEMNNKNVINIINTDTGSEEMSKDIIEAKFIVDFIKKTIINDKIIDSNNNEKRNVKFSDFCILLKSANKKNSSYLEVFDKYKIPYKTESAVSFFKTEEVKILFSFLKVIDNPLDDISLLCIAINVFDFNVDDLIKIKENNKKNAINEKKNINEAPLFFNIKKTSYEKINFDNDIIIKKCKEFLKKIENFQQMSPHFPVDKFVEYIINNFITTFSFIKNFSQMTPNVKKFLEIIRNFMKTEINVSLSSLIEYLKKLENNETVFYNFSSNLPGENCVQIMSIHKSKGLEFPICIIAGCSHEFLNEFDQIIFNHKVGMGFKLKNEESTLKFQNLIRKSCEIIAKKENISEMIRLFYVALTRAKKRIVFMVTIKNVKKYIDDLIKSYEIINNEKVLLDFYIKNSNSFTDWILLTLIKKNNFTCFEKLLNKNNIFLLNSNDIDEKILETDLIMKKHIEKKFEKNEKTNNEFINNTIKKIEDRFNFSYDIQNKVSLKTTVTEITHLNDKNVINKMPNFYSKKSSFASDLGSALHMFLNFSDFKFAKNNYEENLKILYKKNVLNEKYFKILNLKESKDYINRFLFSDLAQRIINSNKVFKEYQFSILKKIYKNSKPTLIQGAIDCVFSENDGFVLIDYKSDNTTLEKMVDNYLSQVQIYKLAFEKCEQKKINEVLIYSFKLGDFISIEQKYLNI